MGCQFGSDLGVADLLRESLDELFHETRVNVYFAGHLHWIQRQAAIYQQRTVQHAEKVPNGSLRLGPLSSVVSNYEGLVAFHDNPQATVHMLIGTAGQGFQVGLLHLAVYYLLVSRSKNDHNSTPSDSAYGSRA